MGTPEAARGAGQGPTPAREEGSLEVVAAYLVDTSALARSRRPAVQNRLDRLVSSGQVAICAIVELELSYSARGHTQMLRDRADRIRAFSSVTMRQEDFDRAADVMALLARNGKHRAAGIADLLIAACAERARLTLLHYDADFDAVASITGQSVEWVVPRGSVP